MNEGMQAFISYKSSMWFSHIKVDQVSQSAGFGTIFCNQTEINKMEIVTRMTVYIHLEFPGLCDPYVKVHLLPEEKFTTVTKPRTKTHKKTLFPLFDENFTM